METVIKTVKDLKVYNASYRLAMEIFELTKKFPKEETYSLMDQIRRSSRSVAINIREGYAKRRYEQVFIRHLNDSLGSSEETRGWLDFAVDCKYISKNEHKKLDDGYDEVPVGRGGDRDLRSGGARGDAGRRPLGCGHRAIRWRRPGADQLVFQQRGAPRRRVGGGPSQRGTGLECDVGVARQWAAEPLLCAGFGEGAAGGLDCGPTQLPCEGSGG